MIIEDPESFKAWLTAKLEPLCDADPAALAKYVYALVKKDKPVEELRSSMIGQLEVFLQKETQGFVNLLFRILETQRYDLDPVIGETPNSAPAKVPSEFEIRDSYPLTVSNDEPEKKVSKEPSAAILASAQNTTSLGCALLATTTGRKDFDRHGRKGDSDKEDRMRRRGRRGSSASPDRRRSRSRSIERRRSRSRDRDRGRAWRNKSPPARGRYDRDRRHTHSKSPVRRYSKSRSPAGNRDRRTRYRNRSPPRSRTRSRSPISNKYASIDGRERKEAGVGISPRVDNSHGDTDLRVSAVTQNIQSVVSLPSDQPTFQAHRCRDFDEKGYCMRGDLCPYDHGSDPVILEDVDPLYNGAGAPNPLLIQTSQPPPPITVPPPSITQVTTNNMAEYNPDAPSMEPRWSRPHQYRGGPIMRGMPRNGRAFLHQRELVNVVPGAPHFRPHIRPPMNQDFNNSNHVPRLLGPDKQNFDFTRLGPNHRGQRPPMHQHGGGNTSLHLKKVPLDVNEISHLSNHFSKFGKVVNIQVGFEGDPESALITFATHTEANIAYKSTEAVLNNRFIRVFWYNPSNNNENKPKTPAPVATKPSVLERLGAPPPKVLHNIQPSAVQHEEKVTVVNNSITKTLYIPSAMKKEVPVAPVIANNVVKEDPSENLKKKMEEVNLAKKKQEEARKAGIKLNADLRKRKQELLEKQINQQKILISRMEVGNITEQQKKSLMATIKVLQDSIESIRKDLENSVKANLTTVSKKSLLTREQQIMFRKTKEEIVDSGEAEIADETPSLEQTTRELLDAELDLLNSQHEGKDTTELKKKVIELKKKASAFGPPAVRGSYRGRGAALRARGRGRGRGTSRFLATSLSAFDPHNVVDHRPTKILVSGYEQDDKTEVFKHFEVFGEILDYISDDATPSLVLNYKSRKDAEKAILKGRNFHDRLLSVTWATPNNTIRGGMPTKPPTPSHRQVMVLEDEENIEEVIDDAEDEDEDIGTLSPDILIHDDEDDDEEDRSWRR